MLSYTERGRGPALVLIHAFPLDHTMWLPQINAFSPHHRVITPDVRGFGGSTQADSWTMAEMVEEIEDLLSTLDVEQCSLAGLSMGGYIALNYAEKYRNRVSKLVLAHTRARADTDAEKQKRTDMIAALERDGIRILPDAMLGRLLKPDPDPEIAALVRKKILSTNPEAAAHAVAAMRDRPDATPFLKTIACPALVLAGQADAVLPIDDLRSLAAGLPNGRMITISGAGHLSNLENSKDFNAALAEFLAA